MRKERKSTPDYRSAERKGFSFFYLRCEQERATMGFLFSHDTRKTGVERGIFDRGTSRRRSDYVMDYIFSVCHLHRAGMAPRYWKYIFIFATCILSRSGSKVFPCGWSFSPERTAMECTSIIDLFILPMRRTMIVPAGENVNGKRRELGCKRT